MILSETLSDLKERNEDWTENESESTYICFQAQLLNMCYSGLVLITDKTVENAFCCEFELKCLWGLF